MARVLAELLGVNQTLLADDIKRLEHASGHNSADVKLVADILRLTQQKIRELGLDPRDTNGKELYFGLLNLVRLHDNFLAQKLGVSDASDANALLPKIRDAVTHVNLPKNAWVVKPSVAKRLLRNQPPKALMRYLGYKSLDSMLKRESVADLFGGLRLVEPEGWYRKFVSEYCQLTPMDFEVRPVEIRLLDKAKWQKAVLSFIEKQHHNILEIRELGAILILPLPFENRPGTAITLLPLLLHSINEIRLYSSFFKLHQMQSDFGERIVLSLLYDRGTHVKLGHQDAHWRVVQRNFGSKSRQHPEIFEPHVTADDLEWRQAEVALYHIEPALHFWSGTDYVAAFHDSKPVSFNLLDVALNYFNQLPYEQRVYMHAQNGLWNELFVRYMSLPALESQVLKSLDYQTIDPELFAFAEQEK